MYTQSDSSLPISRDKEQVQTRASPSLVRVRFLPPDTSAIRASAEPRKRREILALSIPLQSITLQKVARKLIEEVEGMEPLSLVLSSIPPGRHPGVPISLRDSRDSVMSDTSAIGNTSTTASSVADELARLRARAQRDRGPEARIR